MMASLDLSSLVKMSQDRQIKSRQTQRKQERNPDPLSPHVSVERNVGLGR